MSPQNVPRILPHALLLRLLTCVCVKLILRTEGSSRGARRRPRKVGDPPRRRAGSCPAALRLPRALSNQRDADWFQEKTSKILQRISNVWDACWLSG